MTYTSSARQPEPEPVPRQPATNQNRIRDQHLPPASAAVSCPRPGCGRAARSPPRSKSACDRHGGELVAVIRLAQQLTSRAQNPRRGLEHASGHNQVLNEVVYAPESRSDIKILGQSLHSEAITELAPQRPCQPPRVHGNPSSESHHITTKNPEKITRFPGQHVTYLVITNGFVTETSDQMKHLGERIPATFVYAGVDVEASPLLNGPRGAQLAGRFTLVRNTALSCGTTEQRIIWLDLITDMERALRLRHHTVGTLARHADYLHQRTGGVMGSLSHLIREAALTALLDGSEKITKRLLAGIQLDIRAEQQARPPRKRIPRPRSHGTGS